MKDDLEFLRLERQHLEAMKRSGVEMNRSGYRSLFFSLFLFALAEAISTGLTYAGAEQVGRVIAIDVPPPSVVVLPTRSDSYPVLR
jgi:hypothetical protein